MQTFAGCVDEKQSRAERGFGDMETEEDKDGNDETEKHLKSVKNDLCDFSRSCIWYDDDDGSGGDESENSRHRSWRMCQLSGWGLSLSATDALPTVVALQDMQTVKKLVNCNFFYSVLMRIRHMMWWLLVIVRQFTFVTLAKCLRSFSIIFSRICDHAVTVGVCGSSKKKSSERKIQRNFHDEFFTFLSSSSLLCESEHKPELKCFETRCEIIMILSCCFFSYVIFLRHIQHFTLISILVTPSKNGSTE